MRLAEHRLSLVQLLQGLPVSLPSPDFALGLWGSGALDWGPPRFPYLSPFQGVLLVPWLCCGASGEADRVWEAGGRSPSQLAAGLRPERICAAHCSLCLRSLCSAAAI